MEMQNIVAQTTDLFSVRVTEETITDSIQGSKVNGNFEKVMSKRLEANGQKNEKDFGTASSTRTVSNKRKTEILRQNDKVDVKADNVADTELEEEVSQENITLDNVSVLNPKEEAVSEWKEEVATQICEDLDITPEEFEEFMAQLGLQVTDLQDVSNLQQLILTASGESDQTLFLTDEDLGGKLQTLVEDVAQITKVIQEEFSISEEEFSVIPEDIGGEVKDTAGEVVPEMEDSLVSEPDVTESEHSMEQVEETSSVKTNVTEVKEPDTKILESKPLSKEEEVSVSKEEDLESIKEQEIPEVVEEQIVSDFVEQKTTGDVATQLPKKEAVVVDTEEMEPEKTESASDVKIEISVEKEVEGYTTDEKQSEQRNDADGQKRQSTFDQFVSNLAVDKTGVAENVETKAVVVEQMKEIVNQVVEQIKVSVKADTSSMEIQLNPEHLGKVNLSVVAKEGHITAQFVTENEMARHALEGQIQQLRETLGQQGLKVDEVEVTVSNFDFKQSNQANAEEQKQQQRNEHNKRVVRNLNLNDIGSMQDLTEEEQLAARIMETNGNQIDYTA